MNIRVFFRSSVGAQHSIFVLNVACGCEFTTLLFFIFVPLLIQFMFCSVLMFACMRAPDMDYFIRHFVCIVNIHSDYLLFNSYILIEFDSCASAFTRRICVSLCSACMPH